MRPPSQYFGVRSRFDIQGCEPGKPDPSTTSSETDSHSQYWGRWLSTWQRPEGVGIAAEATRRLAEFASRNRSNCEVPAGRPSAGTPRGLRGHPVAPRIRVRSRRRDSAARCHAPQWCVFPRLASPRLAMSRRSFEGVHSPYNVAMGCFTSIPSTISFAARVPCGAGPVRRRRRMVGDASLRRAGLPGPEPLCERRNEVDRDVPA